MTLREAAAQLHRLQENYTIYAAKPWTGNSDVIIELQPEKGLPAEAAQRGLEYFLEVFIALEVIEGWEANNGRSPDINETCERLIYYATYDA